MDRYTKNVLTVIAGGLLMLNIQMMWRIDLAENAYARSGKAQVPVQVMGHLDIFCPKINPGGSITPQSCR